MRLMLLLYGRFCWHCSIALNLLFSPCIKLQPSWLFRGLCIVRTTAARFWRLRIGRRITLCA
jgi:hypothetical protein